MPNPLRIPALPQLGIPLITLRRLYRGVPACITVLIPAVLYGKDKKSQAIVHQEHFCPQGFEFVLIHHKKIPKCGVDA